MYYGSSTCSSGSLLDPCFIGCAAGFKFVSGPSKVECDFNGLWVAHAPVRCLPDLSLKSANLSNIVVKWAAFLPQVSEAPRITISYREVRRNFSTRTFEVESSQTWAEIMVAEPGTLFNISVVNASAYISNVYASASGKHVALLPPHVYVCFLSVTCSAKCADLCHILL